MAEEDRIQKQMDFIGQQQAQFASDIGQLRDSIGQLQDVVTRLANASFQRMDNLEDKVFSLVDAQIKTEGNLSALAQAQVNTDKRLDALITMFERYISKGQNGNSQS
jgi:hypothetical protein